MTTTMATLTPSSAAASSAAVPSDTQDDPRMSSAALCLSFVVGTSSFRPEFTHQSFPGEWIRGYQPPRRVLLAAAQPPHSSHAHHNDDETSHELQIKITLAPSCRMCSVDVDVQRKLEVATRASKRPRLMENEGGDSAGNKKNEENNLNAENHQEVDATYTPSEHGDDGDDDSDFSDASPSPDGRNADDAEGKTRGRRMPVDEILEQLDKGLPKRVQGETVTDDFLEEPVGTVLHRYRFKDQDFVVCAADGSEKTDKYHQEVQKLAMWFIETAEDVDLTSDGGEGGYWKVLYLFHEHGPHRYALAGYITLFHFESPFKKPKPGIVARVCQILILPPYQRSGHGKMLLRTIHDKYVSNELACHQKDIVEINVEDPAPGCVALRNRVDFERFRESLSSETPWLPEKYRVSDPASENFFLPVSDADALTAGAIGRVTPRQVQITHELYKLSLLPACEEPLEKKYRLMVKKRLLKAHREDLGTVSTKEEKQKMLGEFFDETYSQYKALLGRN